MEYFVEAAIKRLLLIAAMAIGVFAVGSVVNYLNPPSQEPVDYRQAAVNNSVLTTNLYDPVMQATYVELKAEGALGQNLDNEARLTFSSPSGKVVLTRSDIQKLNARYRAMASRAESEPTFEELKQEQLAREGWGDDSAY